MNKTALITGASRGIGFSISKKLASLGVDLVLLSRDLNHSSLSVKQLSKSFPNINITPISIDLSDLQSVSSFDASSYKIDYLVNCAGIFSQNYVEDIKLDECLETIYINQLTPLLLAKSVLIHMKSQSFGRILNIGSSSSYDGFPKSSLYCSSKHALLGISRSLDAELSQYGIRSFCISPGSVQTDMGRQVENQDFNTFINPDEFAELAVNLLTTYDSLIVPEILVKRTKYS